MTLDAIRARLRRGFHPEDFGGKPIGSGAFRCAYRVGNYVVKMQHKHCGHSRRPADVRDELASFGIKMSPSWKVGRPNRRAWVIQPYYRAVNWSYKARAAFDRRFNHGTLLDVQAANCGYDREWNLVAFDY